MDPDPGKEIEVDPDPGKEIEVDPDPERELKWIRIWTNAVDPDPNPDPKRCFLRMTTDGAINT